MDAWIAARRDFRRSLRRPQRPLHGWHRIAELVELSVQPLRYEHLIETGFQLVHA